MPRGYRCILVAFVGWLSLAAQTPNPPAKPQEASAANAVSQASQNVAPSEHELAERAHRTKYEAECDPAKEQRDSDLCAQWKAADAAASAAKWTKWGTWVSGLSGLLVVAALFLAFHSNRIARDTAKRQLRAYLNVSDIDPTKVKVGSSIVANMTVKNNGQTPAHDVVVEVALIRQENLTERDFVIEPFSDAPSKVVISANEPAYSLTKTPALSQAQFDAFRVGACDYFVHGRIRYRDIFNEPHETHFRQVLKRSGIWGLCAEGNKAD